jgi:hypothetical protein
MPRAIGHSPRRRLTRGLFRVSKSIGELKVYNRCMYEIGTLSYGRLRPQSLPCNSRVVPLHPSQSVRSSTLQRDLSAIMGFPIMHGCLFSLQQQHHKQGAISTVHATNTTTSHHHHHRHLSGDPCLFNSATTGWLTRCSSFHFPLESIPLQGTPLY